MSSHRYSGDIDVTKISIRGQSGFLQQVQWIALVCGLRRPARGQGRHPALELGGDLVLEARTADGPAAVRGGAQFADHVLVERLIEKPAVRLSARLGRVAQRRVER